MNRLSKAWVFVFGLLVGASAVYFPMAQGQEDFIALHRQDAAKQDAVIDKWLGCQGQLQTIQHHVEQQQRAGQISPQEAQTLLIILKALL